MLNTFVLVGRIKELPQIKETSNGLRVATMLIEVERGFKNIDGIYEWDVFPVTLWKGLAETTVSVAKVNDIVALKGRIHSNKYETKDERVFYNHEFIVEKLSFIK